MDKNEQLLKLLEEKIKYIDELLKNPEEETIRQWKVEVLMVLDNLIDQNSKYYQSFEKLRYSPSIIVGGDIEGNKERHKEAMFRDLPQAKSILNGIVFGSKNKLISP